MSSVAWRRSNMAAFLTALGGEMGIQNALGAAEDNRLTQPRRVDWVPVERSGEQRECTDKSLYQEHGLVFFERSFEYEVRLRGQDEAEARDLETKLSNGLVRLNATRGTVDIGQGDFQPGSTAAEQGALITWRLRVWEPIWFELYQQGHIATTSINVEIANGGGTVP
jgi:hypothetical protein